MRADGRQGDGMKARAEGDAGGLPSPGCPQAGLPPLVPVVIQDAEGGDVLMLAYCDREALVRTLADRQGWFFSRSRGRLWRKGETSGNVQEVVGARLDCDGDAVLLQVRQEGPACHTGNRSCFYRELGSEDIGQVAFGHTSGPGFLSYLEQVVAGRAAARPEGSYTAALFAAGMSRILQKVGEEAVEFILAAADARDAGKGDSRAVAGEAADLIFHLLVALRAQGISLDEVLSVLRARHAGSE